MFVIISKPELKKIPFDDISTAAEEVGVENLADLFDEIGEMVDCPILDYKKIINSEASKLAGIPDKDSQRAELVKICDTYAHNLRAAENQFYVGRVPAPVIFEYKTGDLHLIYGEITLLLLIYYDIPPSFYWIKEP